MSLYKTDLNNERIPIAVSKAEPGSRPETYYIGMDKQGVNEITAHGNINISPIPPIIKNQRVAVYISGASGSGKSMMAARIAKQLQSRIKPMFKTASYDRKTKRMKQSKMRVVFFTGGVEEDPAFNIFDKKDTDEFLEIFMQKDPLFVNVTTDDLKDTICIFDDYENLQPASLAVFTFNFIKKLLEVSRKNNTQIIVINHQSQNYNLTKPIIFECNSYILFPWANKNSSIKFLESYGNTDKNEIRDMINSSSDMYDFLYMYKSAPRYYMNKHKIKML